jgi:hypothetical protein
VDSCYPPCLRNPHTACRRTCRCRCHSGSGHHCASSSTPRRGTVRWHRPNSSQRERSAAAGYSCRSSRRCPVSGLTHCRVSGSSRCSAPGSTCSAPGSTSCSATASRSCSATWIPVPELTPFRAAHRADFLLQAPCSAQPSAIAPREGCRSYA